MPIEECWTNTGKKPVGVRWVDIKGTRSKEIKVNCNNDLFAATAPIEAKKMLFAVVVMEGLGHKRATEKMA